MHLPHEEPRASARVPRSGAALVIEGNAIVVDRVALVKSAVARAASAPPIFASDALEEPMPPAAGFGRRGGPFVSPVRRHGPDLLFQGCTTTRAPAAARSTAAGMSLFLWDTAGSIPAGRKMAALGVFALALLVPAAVAIVMNTPAPRAAAKAVVGTEVDGFVVEDIDARIRTRKGGDILEVEGIVRNVSNIEAPVPPLRIALSDDRGTTTHRPVATVERSLAAGAQFRFHSAVALPTGTDGDISVGFAPRSPPQHVVGLSDASGADPHDAHRKTAYP